MTELDHCALANGATMAGAAAPAALARTAVGASAAWREATVGGVRLAYDDEGEGPAVVCLHAIGHGAGDFARLRARLRGRYRVVAVDWPGQGRSGEDAGPPSAARYAALLGGLLDGLGIEPAVIVGNSIGGAAAIRHAAARPERVRGLVLENPGGLAPVDDLLAHVALAGMARFFAAGARGARWFPAAFALYYRLVLPAAAAGEARRRIVARAPAMAPLLEAAWRGFARPESDLRALAGQLRCPVLFAWATRDRFVSLARSRAAIDTVPGARLVRFRAGHAAHLETPEEFERVMEGFLDELRPAAGGHRSASP
jgi:4,5:9,10-diseco-3-hydroxy-5,9,17-trioxoandrosta-1(10),2-diene-4-oate hydrolase